MNRNKKGLHKVTANVLSLTLASVMAAGAAGEAVSSVQVYAAEASQTESVKAGTSVYLNGTLSADSKGDGTTKEKAVSSIDTALKLAGSQGTILVCGPVTISSVRTLSIPSGVQIKRDPSYTGAIIKITGKGKLTLSGSSLQAADVDTSAAELGTGALVQETKTEMKKEGQVTMASQVTVASPEAWSSFDFGGAGFTGEGTFSWASQTAPAEYQSSVQVVFTPKDTQNYDYSKVQGWDSGRNAVVRNVEVTIESLKPADPVVTTEEETSQQPVEESQQTEILEETETETQKPETPEQSKPETQQPETPEQTEPETQQPETPEQTMPEKTETEEKDTQDSHTDGNNAQTGEEQTAGQVTIPEEVKLTAPEEIEKFDFAKAGFAGEGTFSWEKEFTPDTYETEVKVIFTPSDKEKKDYSVSEKIVYFGLDGSRILYPDPESPEDIISYDVVSQEAKKIIDTDKDGGYASYYNNIICAGDYILLDNEMETAYGYHEQKEISHVYKIYDYSGTCINEIPAQQYSLSGFNGRIMTAIKAGRTIETYIYMPVNPADNNSIQAEWKKL